MPPIHLVHLNVVLGTHIKRPHGPDAGHAKLILDTLHAVQVVQGGPAGNAKAVGLALQVALEARRGERGQIVLDADGGNATDRGDLLAERERPGHARDGDLAEAPRGREPAIGGRVCPEVPGVDVALNQGGHKLCDTDGHAVACRDSHGAYSSFSFVVYTHVCMTTYVLLLYSTIG